MNTLPEFYELLQAKLGTPFVNEMGRVDRDLTFSWLFQELESRFPNGARIVETGCIRSREDWSAGYATWWFGQFLDLKQSGSLTSVDNDIHHLRIAGNLCLEMKRVFFQLADSVEWLEDYDHGEPFSLAYLDSLDTYEPNCAEHGLAEAKAAAKIVAPNGLIVFDDSPRTPDGKGWQGKGRLGIVWLQENGWKVNPISSYQCVLERV